MEQFLCTGPSFDDILPGLLYTYLPRYLRSRNSSSIQGYTKQATQPIQVHRRLVAHLPGP